MKIIKIVKKLFGLLEVNNYLIETENSSILIDACCNIEDVKKKTSKPLVAIFITHGHFDHIYNLDSFKNIKIYASSKFKEVVENNNLNASNFFSIKKTFILSNYCPLQDGEVIKIDNLDIKCIYSPGHSSDSCCYLINENLFCGDLIFENSIGRIDLFGSNKNMMIQSLSKIKDIDCKIFFSGHGENSTKISQQKNITKWLSCLKNSE